MDCAVKLPGGVDSGPARGVMMVLPGPIIHGVLDSSVFSIAVDVVEDEDTVAAGDLIASELVGKAVSDPAVIILNISSTGRNVLSESLELTIPKVSGATCISSD
jgi:hypothetical protein